MRLSAGADERILKVSRNNRNLEGSEGTTRCSRGRGATAPSTALIGLKAGRLVLKPGLKARLKRKNRGKCQSVDAAKENQ